mmetsp:Transcript_26520/g.35468  ORF Transcript_26520/g.35468 Transcript_26520/m.35468 type:complete len:82 (-) Transcript_26520:188-433(-)
MLIEANQGDPEDIAEIISRVANQIEDGPTTQVKFQKRLPKKPLLDFNSRRLSVNSVAMSTKKILRPFQAVLAPREDRRLLR